MVQPALSSRFSPASEIVEGVDLHWDREAEHPFTPVDTNQSLEMSAPQSMKPVQQLFSAPESDTAFNPIQRQTQQESLITSPSNQVIQPSSTLPQPNLKQVMSPTANSRSTSQFTIEEPNQTASLQPLQVLQPSHLVPLISHLSSSTGQPNPGSSNTSKNEANTLLDQPLSAQNHHDRSVASKQPETLDHTLFPQPITPQDYNDRSNRRDHSIANDSNSLAQLAAPKNSKLALRDSYPQSLAESVVAPPTIRVVIGRVEVRAMMPAQPTPKATPVRSRPAVSLDAYLKQRRS
ncbi:hypothetical protein [Leptolyngbya sp. GGD]|uniref:hypothetical protein n=1 Tax=Leptolyngbya sp. GGD TaxID=2997907 RepID=UPI00227BFAC8|nr:hypothetical protein [Leptolyngbya sp. GGD]MCY6493357.1 hypothetical protein [Leptolyngbya sp. GGD]